MIDRSSDESHYSITRHSVHPSYRIVLLKFTYPYCRGRGMNVENIYPFIHLSTVLIDKQTVLLSSMDR